MRIFRLSFFFLFFGLSAFAQSAVNAGSDKELTCFTKNVVLNGTGPSTAAYYWTSDKGFYSKKISPEVTVAGVYILHAEDNGKKSEDEVLVFDKKIIPAANAGADKELTCIFPETKLSFTLPNTGIAYGFQWKGANGFVSNEEKPTIKAAGIYVLELFKGYCQSFDTVRVKDNITLPKANAGKDILLTCKKSNAQLQPISPSKETFFEWKNSKGDTYSTDLSPFVSQAGQYIFKVKHGICESKDTLTVTTDFKKPIVTGVETYRLPCTKPFEVTTALQLTEKTGINFSWKDAQDNYVGANQHITVQEAGKFLMVAQDEKNGCKTEFPVSILKADTLLFDIVVTDACSNLNNGTIELTNIKGGKKPFSVSINTIDYQEITKINNLNVGKYTLTLKDTKGCVAVKKITILPRPVFDWNLETNYRFCSYGKPLLIDASVLKTSDNAPVVYTWNDGVISATRQFVKSGKVWVEAKNECYTLRKEITIEDDFDAVREPKMYVPNIFNPAHTGSENATFKPYTAFPMFDYSLAIFDKTGAMIFLTKDEKSVWDGTFANQLLHPNVYYWQVSATINACGNPVPFHKAGSVLLIRN